MCIPPLGVSLARMLLKGGAQERNSKKKMDTVEHISVVDHIRKRLGMYWLTRHDIPDKSVWMFLLDQLANEVVKTFKRKCVTYVDMRYAVQSRTMSFEYDGTGRIDELRELCEGGGVNRDFAGHSGFAGIGYPMMTALSRHVEIVTCTAGEWNAVQCRDGKVGAVEQLFPEVMGSDGRNLVRVNFVPSEDYLAEGDLEDVWSDESLQWYGNGLAARCPGLGVSVNGRKYFYPEKGMQGYVEERIVALGGKMLIPPRTGTCGNVDFACGAVEREDSIRRVFGKVFLNGREMKSRKIMERIMRMVTDCLFDCKEVSSVGYDFVFAVMGESPEALASELNYCYHLNRDIGNYDIDTDPCWRQLLRQMGWCMLKAFKEYMK